MLLLIVPPLRADWQVKVHVEPTFEDKQVALLDIKLADSFAADYQVSMHGSDGVVAPNASSSRPDNLGFLVRAPGFPVVRLNAVCGPFRREGRTETAMLVLHPNFKSGIAPSMAQILPMAEGGIPIVRVVIQNPTDTALPVIRALINAADEGRDCYADHITKYDVRLSASASLITAAAQEEGDVAVTPPQTVEVSQLCGSRFAMSVGLALSAQLVPRGSSTLQLKILAEKSPKLDGWEHWVWSFVVGVRMPDGGELLLPTGRICVSPGCRKANGP